MSKHVRDLMTTQPRCVTPDTPVTEVARMMGEEDVGSVPVIDGERLVGVVTDRDIVLRAVAQGKDPRGMPAREVASVDLVTIREDEGLADALEAMARHQVRRLPVIDKQERVIGILAQADVALEAKDKEAGELLEEISRAPQGPRV